MKLLHRRDTVAAILKVKIRDFFLKFFINYSVESLPIMLIELTVGNYRSFKKNITFSMVPAHFSVAELSVQNYFGFR